MTSDPSAVDVAVRLAERFDEEDLPYAFGGALALGAWGVPRATADVDVAVFVSEGELVRVVDALERAGAMVRREDAGRSVARTGMLSAVFGRTGIDVFLAFHPLHHEMHRRRVSLATPGGRACWFLSAEDVVLTKLIYGRPKDVVDLDRLFAVQGKRLDMPYIQRWLSDIVPAGDARHEVFAGLKRRFEAG